MGEGGEGEGGDFQDAVLAAADGDGFEAFVDEMPRPMPRPMPEVAPIIKTRL